MSTHLTPHFTVRAPRPLRPNSGTALAPAVPTLAPMRRAVMRLQARHIADAVIRELMGVQEPTRAGAPLWVRLDVLGRRYAELGGDPADLQR